MNSHLTEKHGVSKSFENMKILHICTMDSNGAGKAALRLHLGLKSLSIKSKMLVVERKSLDNDVVQIKRTPNVFRRAWNRLYNQLIASKANLDLFSDVISIYEISQHPLVKEADIINLHWIAYMVDYREFFRNTKNKPIIWTLHDRNPMTGGCHVIGNCKKYQTGCGNCPQLKSTNPNDLSYKIFKQKEEAYKNNNIHIVAASRMLADCVYTSKLFKNCGLNMIPHGLPTSVFIPQDKKASRNIFGLPINKTLILFVADRKANKGFHYLVKALKLLKGKIDLTKIALVTVGSRQDVNISSDDMRCPIYQLGYIENETSLSKAYSAADMFVNTSIEEAFSLTCLESMSSGTPPIGFNTGGMPDMIIPHKTGLLVELKNTKDLADKIEHMITHREEREKMGKNARKLIEQEYTVQIQAKHYLEIYKMMSN